MKSQYGCRLADLVRQTSHDARHASLFPLARIQIPIDFSRERAGGEAKTNYVFRELPKRPYLPS